MAANADDHVAQRRRFFAEPAPLPATRAAPAPLTGRSPATPQEIPLVDLQASLNRIGRAGRGRASLAREDLSAAVEGMLDPTAATRQEAVLARFVEPPPEVLWSRYVDGDSRAVAEPHFAARADAEASALRDLLEERAFQHATDRRRDQSPGEEPESERGMQDRAVLGIPGVEDGAGKSETHYGPSRSVRDQIDTLLLRRGDDSETEDGSATASTLVRSSLNLEQQDSYILESLGPTAATRSGASPPVADFSKRFLDRTTLEGSATCLRQSVDLAVIGPTGSDMLLEMPREDARWTGTYGAAPSESEETGGSPFRFTEDYGRRVFSDARVLSPRATIDRSTLDFAGDEQFSPEVRGGGPLTLQDEGIRLVHIIGRDGQLVDVLHRELALRGVWPNTGSWRLFSCSPVPCCIS